MKRRLGLTLIILPIIVFVIAAVLSYPFGAVPSEGTETFDTYVVVLDIPYAVFFPGVVSTLVGVFLIVRDSNQKKLK